MVMNRGQAQWHIPSAPVVFQFADGGTYLSTQPVDEAERALDEAASAAYVDMKFAEANAAMENHLLHYGYDRPDLMGAES